MNSNMKRKRADEESSSPAEPPRPRAYGTNGIAKHSLPIRDSFASTTSTIDEADDTPVLAGPKAMLEVAPKPIEGLGKRLPQASGSPIAKSNEDSISIIAEPAQAKHNTVSTPEDPPPSPKRRKTGKSPKVPDADYVPEAITSPLKPKSKARSKVPKPPPPDNPLFWQDSEITGDLITDPDDDGEGLNGVGFELPPHRAYAVRKERRQKIIQWNNQLAKEARQERSNKRKSLFGGDGADVVVPGEPGEVRQPGDEAEKQQTKKAVRFDVAMSATRHQVVNTMGATSKVDEEAVRAKKEEAPSLAIG